MKTTIYIITHKKFDEPKLEDYKPLQVGFQNDLGYLRDNKKDNISDKNENYCELTGLYWIWKNDNESDIVGISHYRRYFTLKLNKIIVSKNIQKILDKYDVIIPKNEYYKESVEEQYCNASGFSEDLELLRKILSEKYPDYIESYDKIMKRNYISQYNMMICKKKLFNDYCKWLFDILFELEKNIDLSKYNDYQKRIYGFLSERLLNVWIDKNNLKSKKLKVINTENKTKDKVKLVLRRQKNKIVFKLKKERNYEI